MTIAILSPQLANQIAAGEVVERPASVVKELLENSLDAGATQIEIDIERGGSQLIRIRDNGCGIAKAELGLALSRHATSKVSTLSDLEQIISLGFRGEALASISSVSRLTLTSRTAEQSEAWSALAEGRDMAVTIKPAAHPVGSCLEVADLFFNTPARRRFLRTDKTEYAHIDEVVRRVALSRFDVQIKLSHNGVLQRQYRVARNELGCERRIAAICGKSFVDGAIKIDSDYEGIKVKGWLGLPHTARNQTDIQYCYVNGRMMRDKLINHAIRQAYADKIPNDLYPAYVLYIEIDPSQVDVNVHPSKHEVRFHQSRLVHDFVYQTLQRSLQQNIDAQMFAQLEQSETIKHDNTALQKEPVVKSASEQINTTQAEQSPTISSTKTASNASNSVQEPATAWLSENAKKLFPGQIKPTKLQTTLKHSAKSGQNSQAQIDLYANLLSPNIDVEDKVEQKSAVQLGERRDDNLSDSLTVNQTKTAHLIKPKAHQDSSLQQVGSQDSSNNSSSWQLLTEIENGFILCKYHEQLSLVKKTELFAICLAEKLADNYLKNNIISQPLLLPVAVKVNLTQLAQFNQKRIIMNQLGVELKQAKTDTIVVQKVPALLREVNLANLISDWLNEYQVIDNNAENFPKQAAFLLATIAASYQRLELSKIKLILRDWQQFNPEAMQQWMNKHSKMIDLSQVIENW